MKLSQRFLIPSALLVFGLVCTPAAEPTAPPIPTPTATVIPASLPTPAPEPIGRRSVTDRPDDTSEHQVHVIYVLPSDGNDEKLDINGVIATSIAASNNWFFGQTGKRIRFDTYQGILDISFFRLSRTDADIRSYNAFVRDQIEYELWGSGRHHPNKIYAVYYGGSSNWSCGGGSWPPELLGNVVALYLKGTPPGAPICASVVFSSSPDPDAAGILEFSIIHELLHALGFVAPCAPRHTLAGHVSDNPEDLMYAGRLPWRPSLLDVGRDDYFGHSNVTCLDLATSSFLDPSPLASVPPPKWPSLALSAHDCDQLNAFRSRKSGGQTSIEFVNVGANNLQVYWLDYDGQRKRRTTLAPWEILRHSTSDTHAWLVTDAIGECLGIYVPLGQTGRAIIGR